MLHIGVVFVVFGTFLIGAGILPDDMSTFNIFGEIKPQLYQFALLPGACILFSLFFHSLSLFSDK